MSPARRTPESTEQLRATLLEHAQRIITRDGGSALTMRSLAAEAGCAIGLPYTVYTDRRELIIELLRALFARLRARADELVDRAGTRNVAANLAWFAESVLASPAIALVHEIGADPNLAHTVGEQFRTPNSGPAIFEAAFSRYLSAEQHAGRVTRQIDVPAFSFLLGGAIHNLVMSGQAYPKPSRRKLRQHLAATANTITTSANH